MAPRNPQAIIFLPFDEPDGVAASDQLGTLEDLGVMAGIVAPAVIEDAWQGRSRDFDPALTNALVAADAPDGDSLLTRDVTIQAVISIDLANAAGVMTLLARGLDGSAAERYAYGLELEEDLLSPGNVEVRWFWQTAAGVIKTQLAGVFRVLDEGFLLLTATRRWESSSSVVCRYYLGAELLAEVASVDGDIGGGTTGTTSIGGRRTAGVWGRFFSGAIDQITVSNYEMSASEVEATWQRLQIHQPEGVARLRALMPPGFPRAAWDDDKQIGKLTRVAGTGLGLGAAKADELVKNWLPDRTYVDMIGRWEALLGIAPKAFDSLDVRRDRVIAFLRRDNGYSVPQVKTALEDVFDLDVADIEILEFSPTITDAFGTMETERWRIETGAQWSIAGAALRLNVAAGSDIRWEGATRNPCHVRMPISDGHQREAGEWRNGGTSLQLRILSLAAWPIDASVAGLFVYNFRTGNSLWFGYCNPAGNHRIAYRSFVDGVLGARVMLADLGGGAFPGIYLRLGLDESVAGRYRFEWSITGFGTEAFGGAMSSAVVDDLMGDPEEVGIAALGDDAALAAGIDMRFDDFTARMPKGDRAFFWYAFRDPGLPGTEDMIGANLVLRKLRPAHTHAAAITSRSLECDDDTSGCDLGPLGGL